MLSERTLILLLDNALVLARWLYKRPKELCHRALANRNIWASGSNGTANVDQSSKKRLASHRPRLKIVWDGGEARLRQACAARTRLPSTLAWRP
jgi:hypothetical protein